MPLLKVVGDDALCFLFSLHVAVEVPKTEAMWNIEPLYGGQLSCSLV